MRTSDYNRSAAFNVLYSLICAALTNLIFSLISQHRPLPPFPFSSLTFFLFPPFHISPLFLHTPLPLFLSLSTFGYATSPQCTNYEVQVYQKTRRFNSLSLSHVVPLFYKDASSSSLVATFFYVHCYNMPYYNVICHSVMCSKVLLNALQCALAWSLLHLFVANLMYMFLFFYYL